MRFVACLKDRGAKVPADERDRLKFDVRVQSLVEEKLRHQVEEGKAEEKANAALALAIASSIRPASVESGMDSHELEQLDLKPASWVDIGRESVPDGMSPGQRELERAKRTLRGYDTRKTHCSCVDWIARVRPMGLSDMILAVTHYIADEVIGRIFKKDDPSPSDSGEEETGESSESHETVEDPGAKLGKRAPNRIFRLDRDP